MHERRDRDTERELSFHVEQHAAELIKQGIPREEAVRQARLALGGVPQVQEECRDVRPWHWLQQFTADLRLTWRGMRKNPAFTLTVILSLAVCVAVNTAVFTVVDSLLLRPLPFYQPDRLVFMTNLYPKAGVTDQTAAATGDYFDRKDKVHALAEHALTRYQTHPIERGGVPVQVVGLSVTASFFPLLRVQAAEGRLFTEAESEAAKADTIVLTESLRRQLFGTAAAIGQEIRISGRPCRVVGVLPPDFRYQTPDYRYFLPIELGPDQRTSRHANNVEYIARLRDGATIEQVQSQVDAVNAAVTASLPQLRDLLVNAGFRTLVQGMQQRLTRQARPSLQLLWAGALVVLLIGAVNLAGLALARAAGRARETGTRLALGASRARLMTQHLTESVSLALVGGTLGIAGGWFALRAFDHTLLPAAAEIALAPAVIFYAIAAALFAGFLMGLAALLPARGLQLARSLVDGGRGGSARHNTGLRRWLAAAQVALAFVLLYGAGVLTASLRELANVNPGFTVERVGTATTFLPSTSYPQEKDRVAAGTRIADALRRLPGVEQAGTGGQLPFGYFDDTVILPEGYIPKASDSAVSPARLHLTPGYFETLGVRAHSGRLFTERDGAGEQVVIVDEKVAQRFWPGQDAIGRRVYFPPAGPKMQYMTVIGVVPSVRWRSLAGDPNPNGYYAIPWRQNSGRMLSLLWRAKPGAEREAAAAVRSSFSQLVPGAALIEMRSLAERRDGTLLARRTALSLAMVFAGVAVLLAAIGIYGLFAFLLTQRQREIGIRMAMGCQPAGILQLFLRDGLKLALLGLTAGFAVVLAVKSWIATQLYGVGALDPRVLAAVALMLALVALSAVAMPAWRASRLHPARVLSTN